MFSLQEWRFQHLVAPHCKTFEFLTEAEKACYRNRSQFKPYDGFLTAIFLFSECINRKRQYFVSVELSGVHTRGQMILDHHKKNIPNATIIELLNQDECKRILQWTATS